MEKKYILRLIIALFIIIILTPFLASAEPKGVAHRVDLLTKQISELNEKFISIQEENKKLNRIISGLSNKVNELNIYNMQLSEKVLCIDTLPSGDVLVIDCDVILPSDQTNYNSLFVEGGIETKAIQDINDSGLTISSDKSIEFDSLNTTIYSENKSLIESSDQITLKSGSSEIIMKKNGDISIKGKNINIKASGDLVLKGSRILEN